MTEYTKFRGFPKIPRLNREVVVTEKIDGTNASIYIGEDGTFLVGSRTRWITPENDNFGFAAWACMRHEELTALLGPGHHFGEWWGRGINRNYGLADRRFSLFNTDRWAPECGVPFGLPEVTAVPILASGSIMDEAVAEAEYRLRKHGSVAAPGFAHPEGLVVYHTAAGAYFKMTLEDDDQPKTKH